MKHKDRYTAEKADIDLTPMLDVVFIMLIFFIVTASFVKEVGIDINIPPKAPPSNQPSSNILVEINANNEIWMESRLVDMRAVRSNIERLHAENPKIAVIIKASGKASTQSYVAVADAARLAKVNSVSLLPDLQIN